MNVWTTAAAGQRVSWLKNRCVGDTASQRKAQRQGQGAGQEDETGLQRARPAGHQGPVEKRQVDALVDCRQTLPVLELALPALLPRSEINHHCSNQQAGEDDAKTDEWQKTENIQKSQPPEILFIERCVKLLKPGTGRCAIVLPDGILGSPGLGYVRDRILRNTRVLASIDLHPDTFQPHVSVQTSVLVLQRKTDEEIAVEKGAERLNDYEVFMAVANHIGHDKRGNVTYVRDRKGNEIVEEVEETLKEYEGGRQADKKRQKALSGVQPSEKSKGPKRTKLDRKVSASTKSKASVGDKQKPARRKPKTYSTTGPKRRRHQAAARRRDDH